MKALLSIKPKYVDEISNGAKKYEFRKRVFKRKVESILVYSSSPIKKVVGEIFFENILSGTPEEIWEKCKDHAGICEKDFFLYFSECEKAFAIEIDHFYAYESTIKLDELKMGLKAPQSFLYLE